MFIKKQLSHIIWLQVIALSATAASAVAQPATVVAASTNKNLEEVVILGSRRVVSGSSTDTAAPVDVINSDDLQKVGNADMNTMMRTMVPSYNVSQQPNSDEAAFIRPANLRSLPPDNTLILVNGKRRHRGAVITFLGAGISDGAQGADISPIPSIALEQVQVLRDGASAQYGSDAIAGVINFGLKDAVSGGSLQASTGQYYEGDGTTSQIAGNIGLPLTENGFLNLSADYSFSDKTSRSVQRADALAIETAYREQGLPDYIEDPVMIWGAPEVKDNIRLIYNAGLQLNESAEIYSFGNYASKYVETEFYYRNPNNRSGVFSSDGGQTLLVGDVDTSNDIVCPTIAITNNIPDQTALASISSGGELASECFAFNEVYPGGFTPRMGGTIEDKSFAIGIKGDVNDELNYDVSANWGQSGIDYELKQTVNASLGENSPSYFKLGKNIQTDTNFNADLNYILPVDVFASDLNIASGFEWRKEQYEVVRGDEASYTVGPLASQGFSSGSNGYAGYGPQSEGVFSRNNTAVYIDLEADVITDLTLGAAIRHENFDDFGATTNGKISGFLRVNETLALRTTASTGFRAPTPGQSNIVRTVTQGTVDNEGNFLFEERGILPANNPIAKALASAAGGITPEELGPEKSTNMTFGVVLNVGDIDITLDYFHIDMEDRIALTSNIEIDRTQPEQAAIIEQLVNQGIPGASTLTGFQFFTNDFDTTTQGIDIVASIPVYLGEGDSNISLSYNYTETKLDSLTDVVDDTRKTQLEEGLPSSRFVVTGTHDQGPWSFMTRLNYYDSIVVATDKSDSFDGSYGGKFLVDAEVVYHFESLSLSLGAQNLFDEYPDQYPDPAVNSGQKYPEESPFGFNGGYYYLRANYQF